LKPWTIGSATAAALGLTLLTLAGCSSKLETGYEPRKLGMGSAERRALYVDPYTAEAREAQAEKAQDKSRNPTANDLAGHGGPY
jgi:hypothetical protein